MDTWKMKGWNYILWDEKLIKEFKLKNQSLFDYYYNQQNYHGASDVVRIEVIERIGGMYVDADAELLIPFDDEEFMLGDFFTVEANMKGRVANGVICSIPGHPILKNYIDQMGKAKVVLPPWSTIGGTLFTKMIQEHKTENTHVLEPHTFYPHDSKGIKSRTSGKTFARHVWATTHKLYGKI